MICWKRLLSTRPIPARICLAVFCLAGWLLTSTNGRRFASAQEKPQPGLQSFELSEDTLLLPGFGDGVVKYRYTLEDLDDADRLLDRYDANRDGQVDRQEYEQSEWRRRSYYTREDPFEMDLNGDNRLSRSELAQRYALRRMTEDREDNPPPPLTYSLFTPRPSKALPNSGDLSFRRATSEDTSSRESREIAANILSEYDRNRDRELSAWEVRGLGIEVGKADLNKDGELSFREIDAWVFSKIDQKVNDLSELLPDWFFEKDQNGDGQIAMAEYETEWTEERLRSFTSLDANGDGLVTSTEMLSAKSVVGGVYANERATVLAPRSRVLVDIEVEDDIKISKLQVQLSITHSYVEQLDAFLLAPDGTRVELFSQVGRSDDHFKETIFDDEARQRIREGRAPFRGTYQPQAVEKKQPSLSSFKGKSIAGVWQLLIECDRSERFGLLHSWSLILTPAEGPTL